MTLSKVHQRILEESALTNATEVDRLRKINKELLAALKMVLSRYTLQESDDELARAAISKAESK